MHRRNMLPGWGLPPWRIDLTPGPRQLPPDIDIAIIGGGFTGLAAAAVVRRRAPDRTVAVLEAETIGGGSSGRTGGIVLEGTAAGDQPGLGDVLSGFARTLEALEVDCDLGLDGVWELGRVGPAAGSAICWQDSGTLSVVDVVRGGTIDAGRLVSGLARAAERAGAIVCERMSVRRVVFGDAPLRLCLPDREIRARRVLFASNAGSLEQSGLVGRARPAFTLAVSTEPLDAATLEVLGLRRRGAFYTIDLPYLWGRRLADDGVVFGSGLVYVRTDADLGSVDVGSGEAARLLANLEGRVRGLHPALGAVRFVHRWGGPILFGEAGRPCFGRHRSSDAAVVLAGYSGHGVALSVYLADWATAVLLDQREPPTWGA